MLHSEGMWDWGGGVGIFLEHRVKSPCSNIVGKVIVRVLLRKSVFMN